MSENAFHDVRLVAAQGFVPGAWQAQCAACSWRGALHHVKSDAELEGDEHIELVHEDEEGS